MASFKEVPLKELPVICYMVRLCVPPCPSDLVCSVCERIIDHRICSPLVQPIPPAPKPGDRMVLADGTEGTVMSVETTSAGSSQLVVM